MSPVRFPIALLGAALAAALLPAAGMADTIHGVSVDGTRAQVLTTAELNAQSLGRMPTRLQPKEHEEHPEPRRPRPGAAPGPDGGTRRLRASIRATSVTASTTNFDGPTLQQAGAYPPDTMGAVGPTQFVVMINGVVRSYSKATGLPDGQLNEDTDVFWSSVMTTPTTNNFTSDPHIRYDRLSGRWIAVMIDVPGGSGDQPNRIMIAVSDSSTITSSTHWSFNKIQSPGTEFADYPTLGVDANALYIGTNEFSTTTGAFRGTNAYVVQKSSVLNAGTIHYTTFAHVATATGAGPFTPQGVDNPTPGATAGYFIGTDNATFSQLDIRKVNDPGGTTPTLSSYTVNVPATYYPLNVPHPCASSCRTSTLDALEDRLYAAQIRDGNLWTAHNIGVGADGQTDQRGSGNTNDRTASRWYEISLSGTPTLVQSGNVYDNSASTPRSYWIPTLAVNGQGTMAIGGSTGSAASEPDAWFATRLSSDPLGTVTGPTRYTATTGVYNPKYDRWGDYSMTSVDPQDDQTMWTIQEYVNPDSTNWTGGSPDTHTDWGTRIVRLLAPAPLAPTGASPATAERGQASVHVDLSGPSGAGWFDPGSGFDKRLAVTVGCGITVNSVTVDGPSSIGLDLNTSSASRANGCDVTVTNPDGQSATASGLLATNSTPAGVADTYTTPKDTELDGSSVLANDTDADGDALTAALVSGPAHGTLSLAANGTFAYTPTLGYTGTDSFTYRASDGLAQSATTTASIRVVDPTTNRAPVGSSDTDAVPHDGTLIAASVLGNDSDPDGDTLTATKLTDPVHGTLTFASNGTFTYVADAASVGPDSFTYEATDGLLASDPVTVTLTGPSDEPPVGVADSFAVPSSGALSGANVLANDTDPDSDPLTAVGVASPAHGTVTLNPDGTFDYQADDGFSGADTFSYRAHDGRLASAETTVTLNVAAPSPPATGGGGGGGGGGDSTGGTTPASTDTAPAPVAVLTPPSLTSGAVVPIATPPTTQAKPASCVVPKLRRHTVRYSRTKLTRVGCKLGKVRKVRSHSVPRGRVVKTVPKAGSVLAAGAKVAIRIRK